jgi:dolichol kinase
MRYGSEMVRKTIHFLSLAVPIGLYLLSEQAGHTLVLFLALFILTVDVVRLQVASVRKVFYFVFGAILRDHERFNLLGSTYLILSALICAHAFPKSIAVLALSFLVVGDTMAALVGRRWGRIKILDKSLEGSLACLASCVIIGNLYPGMDVARSVIWVGAVAATLSELLPIPLDDNMRIPLAAGFAMLLVQ